ncbi:Rab-like protein 6 [Dissostichus eleginoides]|uniref:Rab-like protein 6 n=1 Tax=Dissostichus eleginoides TaxID=100907 RepID=A0AAD9C247_DISEL|nr:Rab-like protein 6 [Dissostichus eleginoides]
MFSAFKKLVGSEPGQLRDKNIPAGLQSMNQSLQRRFAKGVQYNMKIVIRGDRNTGKSTLWHRLQGKKFVEEYLPTQEIQATSIHWNYKTTDDVVKVEVWDVVDKGQKYPLPEGVGKGKKRGENLKLENEPQESDEVALDAEFLDVYKNCNGIIMMFDITKQWTFNYILRELPKVPTHVPVCVLGNHRDMGEHRVILPDDIRDLIAGLNRPMGASYIHYAESSMKNGFGLKYLHRFFNIPFLQLQRETLLRQLETNQLDMDATLEELCVQQETEDQNYEIFLENLESRSKGFGSPGPANAEPLQAAPAPAPLNPRYPPRCSPSHQLCPPPSLHLRPRLLLLVESKPPALAPDDLQAPAVPGAAGPQKRGFMSRWFGSTAAEAPATDEPPAPVCPGKVHSVDDFVPDERLDKSFLEDSLPPKTKAPPPATAVDSDSDGEGRGNPMVSAFQDELDPDDTEPSLPQPKSLPLRKDVALTSDEEAPPVTQDQDLDSEPELKAPVIHIPKLKVASKAPEAISLTLTPAAEQLPRQQAKKKGSSPRAEDSDTDPEAPAAHQMLSFIMDDPDFESEASDTPKVTKDIFPVRDELLSDLSDDDLQVSKAKEPLKPTPISFKHKDDTDLFGLGFQEEAPAAKESSEEQEEKESKHSSKDKKKKKKKIKEEDEKNKKKHKHKKKEKDEGAAGDEKEKKKKPSRSKKTEVDDLEDFLGGGAASVKRDDGDYEEL